MPVTRVASGSNSISGATSVTVTLSFAPTAGNLLVAIYYTGNTNTASTLNTPAGWTLFSVSGGIGATAPAAPVAIYYRIAQTGDGTEWTFSGTGGATYQSAFVGEYDAGAAWSAVEDQVGWNWSGSATSISLTANAANTYANDFGVASVGATGNPGWSGTWTGGFTDSGIVVGSRLTHAVLETSAIETTGTSTTWTTAETPRSALATFKIPVSQVDHSASPADVAAATDAVTAGKSYSQAPGDAGGATDASTLARTQAVGDSAASTEAVATTQSNARTFADTAGGTDTVAASLSYARTASDVAGAVDVASTQRSVSTGIVDVSGGTDTVAPGIGYGRTAADTVGGVDAASGLIGVVSTSNDIAAAVDATTHTKSNTRVANDLVAANDSATSAHDVFVTVNDVASGSDAVSAGYAQNIDVTGDTAGVTDTARGFYGYSDNAGATDAVSYTVSVVTIQYLAANAISRVTVTGDIRYILRDSTAKVIVAPDRAHARPVVSLKATANATINAPAISLIVGPEIRANLSVNASGSLIRLIPLTGNARVRSSSDSTVLRVVPKLTTRLEDGSFAAQLLRNDIVEEPIASKLTIPEVDHVSAVPQEAVYSRPFMLIRP